MKKAEVDGPPSPLAAIPLAESMLPETETIEPRFAGRGGVDLGCGAVVELRLAPCRALCALPRQCALQRTVCMFMNRGAHALLRGLVFGGNARCVYAVECPCCTFVGMHAACVCVCVCPVC